MNIHQDHLKFKHPFTLICSGPTGSGKTILISKILQNYKTLFIPITDKIIYNKIAQTFFLFKIW